MKRKKQAYITSYERAILGELVLKGGQLIMKKYIWYFGIYVLMEYIFAVILISVHGPIESWVGSTIYSIIEYIPFAIIVKKMGNDVELSGIVRVIAKFFWLISTIGLIMETILKAIVYYKLI